MNLVEVHLLQPVPPANLNRDDTGSPKDALFGGFRRARISSQAQKAAVRKSFSHFSLLSEEERAVRTQLLMDRELLPRFAHKEKAESEAVIKAALEKVLGLGVKLDEKGRWITEYLLFLGRDEIDRLAAAIERYWNELLALSAEPGSQEEQGKSSKRTGKAKAADRQSVSSELRQAFESILLNGGKAADLALFGRMLADRPEWQVDAACQVAHAISTHPVDREFDFYTAVDELKGPGESGAGMMGDIEYYTATFYRYATINLGLLESNLQGDKDLAARSVEAFLRGFILTLPPGKQNTFAAHSLPQFVGLLARRDAAPRNLAAAFEKPVFARGAAKSLTGLSVERLMEYWEKLDRCYGKPAEEWVSLINLSDGEITYHRSELVESVDEAIAKAMQGVKLLLGV